MKNTTQEKKKFFRRYYKFKKYIGKRGIKKKNEASIISMVSQNIDKKIGKDMKYITSTQNKLKNDYITFYNNLLRNKTSEICSNFEKGKGIEKIVLSENLPKPTKWIIETNEPFYNLANSDNLDISREMIMLFGTGIKFKNEEDIMGRFIKKTRNSKEAISKKEKILNKINEIKSSIGYFHNSIIKAFEELNNKYIKIISEEKEENKLNDLFDQYSKEARKLLAEDIEKKNLNNTKLTNKFKVFYSSFP